MTLARMIDLGWDPDRVVAVCWHWEDQRLCLANPLGLLAVLVPGRQRLAVLWNHDLHGRDATLYVVDGTNAELTTVPSELVINGNADAVTYAWFEHSEHPSPNVFTCVCSRRRDQALYQVDIDAGNAAILSVRATR